MRLFKKYDMVNTAAYSNPEPTNCSRPALHEDDIEKSKMLQKLLRSNKPDDLKAANLLIKTMVKEVISVLEIFTRAV